MASNDENMQKLERALTEAHRARQAPLLGQGWAEQVMQDVRHAAPQAESKDGVEYLVWRTAAIAATIALIVTVSMAASSWTPSNEGMRLLTEEFETAPLFFD
ncbi:MAG: hypothetical protein HY038_02365 [Nitrospirae bacterium]|nr:hypothetical protein [Nitrospirota bacterium]